MFFLFVSFVLHMLNFWRFKTDDKNNLRKARKTILIGADEKTDWEEIILTILIFIINKETGWFKL